MEAKNDVRPFEEYKEMIQDMSKDNMIRGLYDLSANINEKINKIENKDKVINELLKRISDLEFEVERLQATNSKAIEYIEEHTTHYTSHLGKEPKIVPKIELQREAYDKLLDILKGVDKE